MPIGDVSKPVLFLLLIVILLLSGTCTVESDTAIQTEEPDPITPIIISSWGYQLQNAEPVEIVTSGFKMVVFDYSRTGDEDGVYSEEEITGISGYDILPVSYISIGEAEDYRFYWNRSWEKNSPEWLGEMNPDWEGNYKVKYWMDEWKQIVFEYLDIIIEQGFSGIYLDIVDGFEYWSDPEIKKNETLTEEDAAQKMITFIKEISSYCKNKGGRDFLIIPQNGERIINFDRDNYFIDSISGIGIEDLFFNGTLPVSDSELNYRLGFIERIKGLDKYVFSVDYVDDGSGYSGKNKERIDKYFTYCNDRGYLPYPAISDRELNELNIIAEQGN